MILIEDGIAPKEVLSVIFRNIPVASPDEEMEVNQLVLGGGRSQFHRV
jgi:hypothetical protein